MTYEACPPPCQKRAGGCGARIAQAYGEHPETARTRMGWALTAAPIAFGGPPAGPAHAPAPGHSTVPSAVSTPVPRPR
jgi:hypothetical protein